MLTIRHKLAATAIAMGLVGCQFVAGIANEKPGQGGGGGSSSTSTSSASGSSSSTGCGAPQCSATCQPYCDHYFGGTCSPVAVYPSETSCCAACGALEATEVACRTLHFTDASNPCLRASFFGSGGTPVCALSQPNFKRLYPPVCGRALPTGVTIDTNSVSLLLLAAGPCSATKCLCDQIDLNTPFTDAKAACGLP
jgi:hypothetical protein